LTALQATYGCSTAASRSKLTGRPTRDFAVTAASGIREPERRKCGVVPHRAWHRRCKPPRQAMMSPDAHAARFAGFALLAGLLLVSSPSRGDGLLEFGPSDRLEVALRAGGAFLEYALPDASSFDPNCGPAQYSGGGWFVDGEVGWRHRDWTFGIFASYMSHHDTSSPPASDTTWDIHLHVTEIGLRATWHHGPLSLGAGMMPWIRGHQDGASQIFNYETPTGPNDYVPSPVNETDFLAGAELHAAFDLGPPDTVHLQLFVLAESAVGNWNLSSTRFGLGIVF
jgi:hypothetical protein